MPVVLWEVARGRSDVVLIRCCAYIYDRVVAQYSVVVSHLVLPWN